MIRFTFATNTDSLDDMMDYLSRVDRDVYKIGREVIRETSPDLLDKLEDTPPRRSYPSDYPGGKLEWTSDNQRKAHWASDGFGAGIPFERSGKLADNWQVEGSARSGGFNITVQNTNPASKFVYGSLAQNETQAARFQQNFHKITGWPLASPIVQMWVEEARDLFIEKFMNSVPNKIPRFGARAFTGRRRR